MRQKTIILSLILALLIVGCGQQPQVVTPESQATVISPNPVVVESEEPAYPAPATTEITQKTAYPAPDTSDSLNSAYPAPSEDAFDATPYPGPDQSAGNNIASPMEPIPGEETMTRGEVFIDTSEVLVLESNPTQAGLKLIGSLPTPCNYLRVKVTPPNAENKIVVEAYSLVEPGKVCIQVLQPFETTVNLGSFPAGSYTIWVNGQQVGEYNQ